MASIDIMCAMLVQCLNSVMMRLRRLAALPIRGQIVPSHGCRQKGAKMLRLDEKLKRIRTGQYRTSDFIIADAKDTDMGSGVTGTGFDRSNPAAPRPRSRREFIDQIKLI